MKSRYDKRIALVLSAFVVIALISVNVYAIFYKPKTGFLALKLFNQYALPGPFFSDDRIQIVPHLKIRFKKGDTWSLWKDYEKNSFLEYHDNPLRYDKLVESNFLRSSGRALAKKIIANKPVSIGRFLAVVRQQNPDVVIDSIEFVYTYDTYMPKLYMMRRDTVFNYVTKIDNP
jgi:hypothetical protein